MPMTQSESERPTIGLLSISLGRSARSAVHRHQGGDGPSEGLAVRWGNSSLLMIKENTVLWPREPLYENRCMSTNTH
jgi:hypothetical protein